jgi:serine/threonine protein kinase
MKSNRILIDEIPQIIVREALGCSEDEISQKFSGIFIVTEFFPQTLQQYFHTTNNLAKIISEDLLLIWIKQIMDGLQFLQNHYVAHRDLKNTNIMINQKGHLVIIDFGSSMKFHHNFPKMSASMGGNAAHMPPEILNMRRNAINYNESEIPIGVDWSKYDIFSLGVLVFEWATGQEFYTKINFREYVDEKIPALPIEFSKNFQNLYQQMVRGDPKNRSSLEQLRKFMKEKFCM